MIKDIMAWGRLVGFGSPILWIFYRFCLLGDNILDISESFTESQFQVTVMLCDGFAVLLWLLKETSNLFGIELNVCDVLIHDSSFWTPGITEILFFFISASKTDRLGSNETLFCAFFVIYIGLIINMLVQIVESYNLKVTCPSVLEHAVVIGLNIVLFAFCLSMLCYYSKKSLSTHDELMLTTAMFFFWDCLASILSFVQHFLFIMDRENCEASYGTERMIKILGRGLYGVAVGEFIIWFLFMNFADMKFTILRTVVPLVIIFIHFCFFSVELESLFIGNEVAANLPEATNENIKRDNTCIVCRNVMDVKENVKVLPCGHCCHMECLERWLEGHTVCPLCRTDLSFLLSA